jgi:hypothetical protein
MTTQALLLGGDVDRWEQAIHAFLAEKERRSGSTRTVQAYSRMLYHFFGALGQDTEPGILPGGVRVRPQYWTLREKAILGLRGCPHRLSQLLLPIPYPYGDGHQQPLRQAGASQGNPGTAQGAGRC